MTVRQHTLAGRVRCTGVGLHSGDRVAMALGPAPPDTGIVFRRTDRSARANAEVRAVSANVRSTVMCTTIGNDAGITVSTIEHLMAAFMGAGIDNVLVELDAPEVPIMDGSAAPFVFMIKDAGIAAQDAPRRAIQLLRRIEVGDNHRRAVLRPADRFAVRFAIAFDNPAVASQTCAFTSVNGGFERDIARARTFGFAEQVSDLRARGLVRGGSLDNAVVVRDGKVLNEGGLRYKDEFVRHKVLDAMGDLYLIGAPLLAEFEGVCSGHGLHHQLVSAVLADKTAWRHTETEASGRDETDGVLRFAAAGATA